jgi:4-hydroxybenzoate polyprenyltransferase
MKRTTRNNIVRYAISATFVSIVLIVGSLIGIGLDWLTSKTGWPILPSFSIICFVYLVYRLSKEISVSEKEEDKL